MRDRTGTNFVVSMSGSFALCRSSQPNSRLKPSILNLSTNLQRLHYVLLYARGPATLRPNSCELNPADCSFVGLTPDARKP